MCSARRRSTDTRRRRSGGASLLEALAAITLMTTGLLALGGGAINLTRNLKTADSTGVATALAQQQLELLRSMPLGAAQLAPGDYTDAANPLRADGTTGGVFTRTWTVSPKDTPSFGVKTVTVRVSWTDHRPHTTTVAGYVRCSTVPCP